LRVPQFAGGTGRIGFRHRLQPKLADRLPALAERHGVAVHGLKFLGAHIRQSQKLMANALESFGDDVEAGIGQKVMNVGDTAGDRVFDGNHGEDRLAILHRRERILEGGARQRLQLRVSVAAGEMRIRARLALESDFLLFGHRSPSLRCRNRAEI
jgi:hypothetical protein